MHMQHANLNKQPQKKLRNNFKRQRMDSILECNTIVQIPKKQKLMSVYQCKRRFTILERGSTYTCILMQATFNPRWYRCTCILWLLDFPFLKLKKKSCHKKSACFRSSPPTRSTAHVEGEIENWGYLQHFTHWRDRKENKVSPTCYNKLAPKNVWTTS